MITHLEGKYVLYQRNIVFDVPGLRENLFEFLLC